LRFGKTDRFLQVAGGCCLVESEVAAHSILLAGFSACCSARFASDLHFLDDFHFRTIVITRPGKFMATVFAHPEHPTVNGSKNIGLQISFDFLS